MFLGRDGFIWWVGVVEDNQDPLVLGRARVRIFGYHAPSNVNTATKAPDPYVPPTPASGGIFSGGFYGSFSFSPSTPGTPGGANQNILIGKDTGETPTSDLPWAVTMMPANMPGAYGIPNLGDWVLGFFLDGEEAQEPCILGYIPGIPPDTIPTDIKERFPEQISTIRSFNTVANLPNSFGVKDNAQKNRFRFEQPSGNVFEMVNDTNVGNPVALAQSSGSNLQLKYKTAILGLNAFEGENKNIEIADGYTKIRHYNGVYGRSSVMPASTENSYRSRSILPTKQFSIGNPLAATSPIGKDYTYEVPAGEGVAGYKYYHPARQDVSPTWDEQDLVRNVGLLMNTVFPPEPIISQTIAALPVPDRGGGGGGGCFLGETLVTMSDWTKKRIDQVKDGDYVYNKDMTQVNQVLFIERVPDKYMWKELYTPSGDYEPFATPNHPLFVDGEWVAIDNEIYPWLGKINSVKSPITCETQGELVYNLWVTGDGTYIVNGFGTTSIMMDGGIMRVCYQNGYLSQDDIMELMREFTTQGNMMTYGSYLFNKLFGYITCKPIVKVLANTIKKEHDFLPRKAMVFLMKVFGKTATLYNKLKG